MRYYQSIWRGYLLTYEQALCWVHDGRNYKKLHPVVPVRREKLEEFLGRYWDYYGKLVQFKETPTLEGSKQLSAEFAWCPISIKSKFFIN